MRDRSGRRSGFFVLEALVRVGPDGEVHPVMTALGRSCGVPLAKRPTAVHLSRVSDAPAPRQAALADRYVIERELGPGRMATVYVARDLEHRRRVALEVLRPAVAASLGGDRFLREIEVAARLQHPLRPGLTGRRGKLQAGDHGGSGLPHGSPVVCRLPVRTGAADEALLQMQEAPRLDPLSRGIGSELGAIDSTPGRVIPINSASAGSSAPQSTAI